MTTANMQIGVAAVNGNNSLIQESMTEKINQSIINIKDIAWEFVHAYYTMLSVEPERLYQFYQMPSALLHCQENCESTVFTGIDEIRARILAMDFSGALVSIPNIDCQSTMNGGILIFVIGTMHFPKTGITRKFAQNFILAEQPNGYYVLNDILRLMKTNEISNSSVEPSPKTVENTPVTSEKTLSSKHYQSVSKQQQASKPSATTDVKRCDDEITSTKKIEERQKAEETPKKIEEISNKTDENNKKISKKSEEPEKLPQPPSSWANLAAVQQNRWQSGVVAESKGPIATIIPIEKETPKHNMRHKSSSGNSNSQRINYQTNNESSTKPMNIKNNTSTIKPSERRQVNVGSNSSQRPSYNAETSIYVSKIVGPIDETPLKTIWTSYGPIKTFHVNTIKGIAFVEYETVESKDLALKNTQNYNNAPMSVESRRARPFNRSGNMTQDSTKFQKKTSRDVEAAELRPFSRNARTTPSS